MCGGSSEAFFERFPNLDYEPFAFGNLEDPTSIMFADSIENGLATNISLIQVMLQEKMLTTQYNYQLCVQYDSIVFLEK